MSSTHVDSDVAPGRDPIVILAADDNFAMPLAVTIRSALEHLAADRKLRIYVLDGGIRDATKERLLRSWPAGRYKIEWVTVDTSALEGLPPFSGHINEVSYYRMLVPKLLPMDVRRVIYLDSDLVICTDLGRLWDHKLSGSLCLAVQDCAAPYLDSSQVLPNFELCRAYLGSARPVPNFRQLRLEPDAAYFNAGVLLIDLAAWREADLTTQLLTCLEQNRRHLQWWDQYALNVVLAGRWGQLDIRWNQGSHAFHYPTWEQSPFDRQTYELLRDEPYIVHFTTRYKPWRPLCRNPYRAKFFEYVDRTDWAGWRPPRLKEMWALVMDSERRLRHGRKWLQNRAWRWLQPSGERLAS